VEFLVHISIELPSTLSEVDEERLRRAERERAMHLRASGVLERIWRDPGRRANWSLYSVPDASALHDALVSLPMWPWMTVVVHPLAAHPVSDES
jgi:muconolactone D-isomerase